MKVSKSTQRTEWLYKQQTFQAIGTFVDVFLYISVCENNVSCH